MVRGKLRKVKKRHFCGLPWFSLHLPHHRTWSELPHFPKLQPMRRAVKEQTRSSLSRLPKKALLQSFTQDLHTLLQRGAAFQLLPPVPAGATLQVCVYHGCAWLHIRCQCSSDRDPLTIPVSPQQTSPPAHLSSSITRLCSTSAAAVYH